MNKLSFGLLQKSLHRLGISQQMEALEVLDLFKGWIKESFGAAAAKEVDPKWVKQSSLGIQVNNALLRAQIKNQELEILEYLRKQKPEVNIKRLRFLI